MTRSPRSDEIKPTLMTGEGNATLYLKDLVEILTMLKKHRKEKALFEHINAQKNEEQYTIIVPARTVNWLKEAVNSEASLRSNPTGRKVLNPRARTEGMKTIAAASAGCCGFGPGD